MTEVARLARFVVERSWEDLSALARRQLEGTGDTWGRMLSYRE